MFTKKTSIRVISELLMVLAIAYALLLLGLYFFQRNFIYYPPAGYYTPTQLNAVGFEEVSLKTSSGVALKAWWSPPENPTNVVVMHFHGNASAVYGSLAIYQELKAKGYGVWAMSYPGYPGADGQPGQTQIVNAAIEQYDYLIASQVDASQVVFYGTSLGAGVAAQLASHRKPALLIAEAPFNSVTDMAKGRFPFVPVSWLLQDEFRSDLALASYGGPLLWLHGTSDNVVPIEQGRKLYDNYTGSKKQLILQGTHHSNVWETGGSAFIMQELEKLQESF